MRRYVSAMTREGRAASAKVGSQLLTDVLLCGVTLDGQGGKVVREPHRAPPAGPRPGLGPNDEEEEEEGMFKL